MAAIDINPLSINFLSPLNFNMKIKRSSTLNFFIQKVNLPSISLQSVMETNQFVNIPIGGDHLQYGDLDITFKVDENLNNYRAIHNWIRGIAFPDNYDEYAALKIQQPTSGEGLVSDIILTIANSAKVSNYEVTFRDAFPIYLGELQFDTTRDSVDYITASATFKYIMYDIAEV